MQLDECMRLLFQHPELVMQLLRMLTDAPWVDALDITTLCPVRTTFHTEGLDGRHGDLAWKINFKDSNESVYLLVLAEPQSTPEPFMSLRILTYHCLLWQQLIRQDDLKEGELPMAKAIVLYTGKRPWTYAHDLRRCFRVPHVSEEVLASLWQGHPQTVPVFVDCSRLKLLDADAVPDLLHRILAVHAASGIDAALETARVLLLPWLADPEFLEIKRTVGIWLSAFFRPRRGKMPTLIEAQKMRFEEVRAMLAKNMNYWEEDLERVGREHEAKGEARGEARGLRLAVKMALEARFPEGARFWSDFLEPCEIAAWESILQMVIKVDNIDQLGSLKNLRYARVTAGRRQI